MKKGFTRNFLFSFLTFLSLAGFSQGEFNNWFISYGTGITFNSGSPVLLPGTYPGGMVTINVSDSAGNFLFNSDGYRVWNKNHVQMPNGMGLYGNGSSFVQTIDVVKKINDDSTYFLFTSGYYNPYSTCHPPSYSIVDLRLNGGLGDVVAGFKNIPLTGGQKGWYAVKGTRAHNNRDAWIILRLDDPDSNYYAAYHITQAGLNPVPVLSPSLVTIPTTGSPWMPINQELKFSPDGTKLYCLYIGDTLEVCQFNGETGQVTPGFKIHPKCNGTLIGMCTQMELSTDSKLFYLTSQFPFRVYQFDATLTDPTAFNASSVKIGTLISHAAIQMGPDWKIYGSHDVLDSLWVINFPSIKGPGCGFQRAGFYLGPPPNHTDGLPQFVQRYKVYIHHSGICVGDSIQFIPDIWPPPDSIHWDFGNPSSGFNNYSNLHAPTHIYADTGIYTVELFVRHNDNRTDTSWQMIHIVSSLKPNLGPDRMICIGDSTTFDAGVCSGCLFQWTDLTTSQTVGTNQTFTTSQVGIYQVIRTDTLGCTGSDTVQLTTTAPPSVTNNPLSKSICSGESTNIILTSNLPGTDYHWTATLSSGTITGFSPDSGLVINQILINAGSAPGIVTYYITPEAGNCVGSAVDFPVTVTPGDSVKISISVSTNNVCSGTSVTFTATPTNGGSSPAYQWRVNGNNVGTNSPSYTYNPISGDLVSCILTSSIMVCISNNPATSNTIQMVVNPLNPVSITISPSANPICTGTSVTFLASTINGGTNPSYQWKVNGINVGGSANSYSYVPLTGDHIVCVVTSDVICPTGNPATSNQITMTVNPNLPVSINITASANPVCSGISVTYSSATINGGTTPFYQWKVNGVIAGTNSSTYTYNPVSGDQILCILTSSIACPIGNPATSNTISMNVVSSPAVSFTACFDTITTTNAKPFKLKGGIPLGGTYSGPGVTNGIFYPAVAGVGTHQINYSYTNAALCTVTDHRSLITISPAPFICGNLVTDIRDNKTYPTVHIGSQCWMAANLNYGTMIPGNSSQRDNCIPEKYCYNDLTANCELQTANYQWDELMQYDETISNQGFCPPGWHVPTEADWNILFTNYINNAFAGSPLKYSGFSGFNALLSGAGHFNKTLDFQGFATFFWSSTSHGINKAWVHGMNDTDPSVSVYPAFRSNAFSVRCLKD